MYLGNFPIISRLAYEDKFKSLEFLRISGKSSTFDLNVQMNFIAWNSWEFLRISAEVNQDKDVEFD